MPEPTNPKKKSLMPSSPLRRTLRAEGHHLSPIVQVGNQGVTDAVVRQLDEALDHHELVKLKVGTESPEDRFEVADALVERTDAQIAQILGRTVLVYRMHPEKPRFEPAPRRAFEEDAGGERPAKGRAKTGRAAKAGGARSGARAGGARSGGSRSGGSRGGGSRGGGSRGGGARAGGSRAGGSRGGARKPASRGKPRSR